MSIRTLTFTLAAISTLGLVSAAYADPANAPNPAKTQSQPDYPYYPNPADQSRDQRRYQGQTGYPDQRRVYGQDQYGSQDQYRRPHKGKGKNKHSQRMGGPSHCPPGLAKKGCVPPGQAKKYQLGQQLPHDMYRWYDYAGFGLPKPADGYYYSRDNQDVVLVESATRNVVELVTILDHIF